MKQLELININKSYPSCHANQDINLSVKAGEVWGTPLVCIIDKNMFKASMFSLAAATLSFFGFMHQEAVGFAIGPKIATSYLIIAAFIFWLSKQKSITAHEQSIPA